MRASSPQSDAWEQSWLTKRPWAQTVAQYQIDAIRLFALSPFRHWEFPFYQDCMYTWVWRQSLVSGQTPVKQQQQQANKQ